MLTEPSIFKPGEKLENLEGLIFDEAVLWNFYPPENF